ncbi:hypothetical protein Pyrfu_1376 [Pyrolobus fumarii 1A]|uniref:Uncharacterized protein n=1 Tax=Pyrolobus fumarii (strain DSM 11204 / 1A) TaxID=694429 RepID=G0EGT6_PYRF1|nr:hypothetical protein [Pyrolobus fumarii]AEM39234.1 hypothetical protein Pyrfu_1376 [Pyrolobus fumarii 1A]
MRGLLAIRVKGVGVAGGSPEHLCRDPCKVRIEPLDLDWRPSRPWGVARYESLMAIRPLRGIAGGTPIYCPGGSSHCYKLEHVGVVTGFWERGCETLAAHIVLCGANLVETRMGPWMEALRYYLDDHVTIIAVDKLVAGKGYCADPLHNPFFHEGGATIVYELYEQIGVPDALVVPGYPALLESIRVGYERLIKLGLVDEPPRIYAVDMGIGVPRWLVDSLDLVEVLVRDPELLSRARSSLRQAGLPDNVDERLEAARIRLLESGEIGRDEVVVTVLTPHWDTS